GCPKAFTCTTQMSCQQQLFFYCDRLDQPAYVFRVYPDRAPVLVASDTTVPRSDDPRLYTSITLGDVEGTFEVCDGPDPASARCSKPQYVDMSKPGSCNQPP